MNGRWIESDDVSHYHHPEFGIMCRVHPFNDGWILSISPGVRSRLSLDVFFNNIFRTKDEAKESFNGLITVFQIKENADERT